MAVRQLDGPSPSSSVVVPHLNRDPVSSLKPWPVTVTLAGVDWVIPALPAADWLAILMAENPDPDDIFPGLLVSDDEQQLEDLLVSGRVTVDDLYEMVLEILEIASGRRWWVALRLIQVATQSWDNIGAELTLSHVDATVLSLAAWLDVLMLTILKTMDPQRVPMFTMQLEDPPMGEGTAIENMEMSADSFLSMG